MYGRKSTSNGRIKW